MRWEFYERTRKQIKRRQKKENDGRDVGSPLFSLSQHQKDQTIGPRPSYAETAVAVNFSRMMPSNFPPQMPSIVRFVFLPTDCPTPSVAF
mmetsp:Transcript_22957/g.45196  ORF Transcript_22957/g.45196 Transcript_22957/m.45196 type:complete len:90 (+) Transcript_22957:192-461(+)